MVLDVDGEKLEVVRAIINLAWELGFHIVAEGVETQKQLAELNSLNHKSEREYFAQGYLFSEPLNRSTALALLLSRCKE